MFCLSADSVINFESKCRKFGKKLDIVLKTPAVSLAFRRSKSVY